MHIQRRLIVAVFAGISILLAAPCHANLVSDVGVQGPVGVTGSGGGVQTSVGVTASASDGLTHIHQCLDLILAVPGCLNEIISSFLNFPPRFLGPRCCNAVLTIQNGCLTKLSAKTNFPFTLMRNFCAARAGSPPPPPPCR